jgi:hypothetical protein
VNNQSDGTMTRYTERLPQSRSLQTQEKAVLALILLIEIWVFSGAFRKFFTHDSLFFIIHAPQTWQQFWQFLLAPSPEKNYRPLNLGLIALLKPWLGLDPRPYHWIPLVFHLANTVLFCCLAKRIFAGSAAVLAATAFWGLHSVAGWITYDITYLSDFLLAFLLLLTLLLAVEGNRRRSKLLIAVSLFVFALSLLTKEAATTFPLAIWITLSLAGLRRSEEPFTRRDILQSFKKTIPLTCLYLILAIAFAGSFLYWYRTGNLYTTSANAAYSINPGANPLAKVKYLYWAFNLPDALSIPNAARNRALALGLTVFLLLIWFSDVWKRRFRLSVVEWSGIAWFAGLNVPSLLLSSRLGKWYLYLPLLGLAFVFGGLAESLRARISAKPHGLAGFVIPGLLAIPILLSSVVQTRSYLISSDAAFQSEVLETCLRNVRELHPTLPPQVTLFFLPAFDEGISNLISSPPLDRGQLFQLYYPGSRVEAKFAHKGASLPGDFAGRSDIIVLQYLDYHIYDVTDYVRNTGNMTLFLLPTFEGKVAPLLKKEPAGGRKLYQQFVRVLCADEGAQLPEDYQQRTDLWLLQYLSGRFSDVTAYYKGRHRDGARRVIRSLESLRSTVDRREYYPDYEHFDTPTGTPVFFPSPAKEIITQIGGSTVDVPLDTIPSGSRLRFDASWMFNQGDGGWAEAVLRTGGKEIPIYREYLLPDLKRRNLVWKEVIFDLQPYANERADLVLKCYNDAGKNTVADWLNWRDIVIETSERKPVSSK